MGRDDFERAQARARRDCAGWKGSDAFRAAGTSLRRAFHPVGDDAVFNDLLRLIDGPER